MQLTANSSSDGISSTRLFSADETNLIGAWRHEVLHIASMTAFASITLNAINSENFTDCLVLADLSVPDEATVHRAVGQGYFKLPASLAEVFESVSAAYRALAAATSILTETARLDPRDGADRIKWSWQAACHRFLSTIRVIEAEGLSDPVAFRSSAYSTPQLWLLRELLHAAIAGETMTSANIEIGPPSSKSPSGIERRRWDRRNVNIRCSISYRGQSHRAQLCNISVGGALLDGADGFPRGALVTVTTDCRRTLVGSVAWATAGKTGLKFEVPLTSADPLLAEG